MVDAMHWEVIHCYNRYKLISMIFVDMGNDRERSLPQLEQTNAKQIFHSN
jgi:hypothetical protein